MKKNEDYTPDQVLDICREYMNEEHVEFVNKAYNFAAYVHKEQKRATGEPYIIHPTQVAQILASLRMDPYTVAAGYLHDVVEDTNITLGDVEELFGTQVATIVDGVTKISKYKYHSHQELLAENHRKMLLATAKDLRVIMVKLADRLHNMRTLKALRPDKQRRIANETLEIYAPLADRLGISKIKWELEDLSLHYINPQQYYRIVHLMNSKRDQREAYISEAIDYIKTSVDAIGIKYDIYGRPKHIYSIYKKMRDKHKQFSELYDLLAIRIVVDSVKDCYAVLGSIHSKWKPIPGRFKDYIAVPKANGYQSLHTTIIGPGGQPLEVQIRTHKMHEIAEYGVAAHWAYKEGNFEGVKLDENEQKIDVFREILELQENSDNAADFMKSVKGEIFNDRVYIFTPQGEVRELPKGSIPLDFAYQVHTEVGSHSVGAKVNGRMVPLNYQLKNGDIVEMLTNDNSTPSRDWVQMVYTSRARNKIKRYFRVKDRQENIRIGHELLETELKNRSLSPKKYLDKKHLELATDIFNFTDSEELFNAVGYGELSPINVIHKLLSEDPDNKKEAEKKENEEKLITNTDEPAPKPTESAQLKKEQTNANTSVSVQGIDNLLIRLAKCCNPIPGDEIVGYITKGRGLTIHRADCPNVQSEEAKKRFIEVSWNNVTKEKRYTAELDIYAFNRNGLLNELLQVINSNTNSLINVNGRLDKEKMAIIHVSVGVNNKEHLDQIISKLKNVPDVYEIKRTVE
ncbi:bifunctional (p)ppGpp synthetase/guanosine-3',5'-bis(diphosphate) 3'-pyrophosphohydrolase [Companilactobacillus allii]|uniref:GTP diphosphokinase n=1 Tax=Companilactobacillus allii TaxID=1847728 RepID=A0A1P8Q4H3_9LACO|nr:bifunctional (p)ppGpp synthetase/guanosine-3',5'-bis(diphosphate) 3'-pyrophosphohydrolase [Companilactobacillus allii]APX72770.1 GTP pyrophosphokinase [Companilactobacillus allii]USQ67558.1 bifunctional (p)ppGpp synthetase/guanosine-3',5'-bis(diphosphate) 3'-pyrophosphohydrolase [Companilactobacillus allii]